MPNLANCTGVNVYTESVTSHSLLSLRYSLNNWTQAPKYYIDIEIQGFLEFQFYKICMTTILTVYIISALSQGKRNLTRRIWSVSADSYSTQSQYIQSLAQHVR